MERFFALSVVVISTLQRLGLPHKVTFLEQIALFGKGTTFVVLDRDVVE